MDKFSKHYEERQDTFYLQAGRLVCRNGKVLFSVRLHEQSTGNRYNMTPVDCDALAHYIVDELNNNPKKWTKYKKQYYKA